MNSQAVADAVETMAEAGRQIIALRAQVEMLSAVIRNMAAQQIRTEASKFDDLTPNLSEAEKVWRCRACGIEQDSSGPVTS